MTDPVILKLDTDSPRAVAQSISAQLERHGNADFEIRTPNIRLGFMHDWHRAMWSVSFGTTARLSAAITRPMTGEILADSRAVPSVLMMLARDLEAACCKSLMCLGAFAYHPDLETEPHG